jgi:TolB-like protein/tetratricopeptide (TPR) repeat protein
MPDSSTSQELPAGHRIGRYTLIRRLGRGGMGVVYVARDERLGRDVALKMIAGLVDDDAVQRFWREARTAASINHPHVCQLYEVDESPDGIYLAMELLDGESLESRMARGPVGPRDAVAIAGDLLGALGALHARGFIHRDVKPSNVFLTAHGAKLLDFGLARSALPDTVRIDTTPRDDVTAAGTILGTPRYMAPEQVRGESLDGRSDLYAVGAVLFEMLAGRPPFAGENVFDLLYATLHEQPPALQGPPVVIAIDRVIRRAMAKDLTSRYADASAMLADIRAVAVDSGASGTAVPVRALTRLVVPPLRLTKADPDVDFLSFGLAEAISGSLATMSDVVVRSPAVAASWNAEGADPRRLAAAADVDLVVAGSLLRSGPQLRVSCQLIDVTSGNVVAAESVRGTFDDIFGLEDALTQAVCKLVGSRIGAPTAALPDRRDVPSNAQAFELFLRGSDYARTPTRMEDARAMFEQAVAADPGFAPAWAMLGRCRRFIGKFVRDREANERLADEAFHRALALSPNLPAAHRYLTYLESDSGRADVAIGRLLGQAKVNRNDAHLFAGLVHSCRYAGLTDASLAAHAEARRLDPTISTSVEFTLALTEATDSLSHVTTINTHSVEAMGAVLAAQFRVCSPAFEPALDALDHVVVPPGYRVSFDALRAVIRRNRDEAHAAITHGVETVADPEAWYMFTLGYAHLGEVEHGVTLLSKVVAHGFAPTRNLEQEPLFDGFRSDPRYAAIVAASASRTRAATAVFERGGGAELLGLRA